MPFPPPGDLLNPGIKSLSLVSPTLAGGFFTAGATREARIRKGSPPKAGGAAKKKGEAGVNAERSTHSSRKGRRPQKARSPFRRCCDLLSESYEKRNLDGVCIFILANTAAVGSCPHASPEPRLLLLTRMGGRRSGPEPLHQPLSSSRVGGRWKAGPLLQGCGKDVCVDWLAPLEGPRGSPRSLTARLEAWLSCCRSPHRNGSPEAHTQGRTACQCPGRESNSRCPAL